MVAQWHGKTTTSPQAVIVLRILKSVSSSVFVHFIVACLFMFWDAFKGGHIISMITSWWVLLDVIASSDSDGDTDLINWF